MFHILIVLIYSNCLWGPLGTTHGRGRAREENRVGREDEGERKMWLNLAKEFSNQDRSRPE